MKILITIITLFTVTSCRVFRAKSAHKLIAEQDGVKIFSPYKTKVSCDSTSLLFSVDYTPSQNVIVETNTGEIKLDADWESRFILNIDCDVKLIVLDVYRLTENGEREKVTTLKLDVN